MYFLSSVYSCVNEWVNVSIIKCFEESGIHITTYIYIELISKASLRLLEFRDALTWFILPNNQRRNLLWDLGLCIDAWFWLSGNVSSLQTQSYTSQSACRLIGANLIYFEHVGYLGFKIQLISKSVLHLDFWTPVVWAQQFPNMHTSANVLL